MIRINGLHEEPPITVKSCKHSIFDWQHVRIWKRSCSRYSSSSERSLIGYGRRTNQEYLIGLTQNQPMEQPVKWQISLEFPNSDIIITAVDISLNWRFGIPKNILEFPKRQSIYRFELSTFRIHV